MEVPWLTELEQKIRAVTDAQRELREENESLKSRIDELQDELKIAAAGESAKWQEQRAQIRRRVEKLASGLEELLHGSSSS